MTVRSSMLRLGATQVKQVAHHAPNGIPSRPPALAGRDVATPIYDVPRVYAAGRRFTGVSLHFIVSSSIVTCRIVSCRAQSIMTVTLRCPSEARASKGDGPYAAKPRAVHPSRLAYARTSG
jgi:hypothetical protein